MQLHPVLSHTQKPCMYTDIVILATLMSHTYRRTLTNFTWTHPGDTAWKRSRLRPVGSTEHVICGPAAKWTHLPLVTKFHTKMAATLLVGMEQDGPDKCSAFWTKPVWLWGLAGVTRVFPVSLHLKASYWTHVYFASIRVSFNVFLFVCMYS